MLYVCVWTQCPGHGMTQDTGHCDGSLLGAIFALTILLLLAAGWAGAGDPGQS